MNKNIIIIGIDYKYNLNIAQLLSESIDMYFLDVEELVNYNLFSKSEMLEKCGIEYLTKQETSVIKSCADYENTIMCMPYSYFFRNKMYTNFLDNSYIIYLYFSKKTLLKKKDLSKTFNTDMIVFEERDNNLNNICNKKINVSNKKNETIVNEILSLRGEYEY